MVRSARIACLGSLVTLPALLSWPAGASEPVYHDHGPGDHPAPPPLSERLHVPEGPLADGEGHTLFVNFDGPTLVELGYDDSTQNSTQFPGMGGPYQPFGEAAGGPMREGILQAVRQIGRASCRERV